MQIVPDTSGNYLGFFFLFLNRTTPGPHGPKKIIFGSFAPNMIQSYNFHSILLKFIWQLTKTMVHKTMFAFFDRTTPGASETGSQHTRGSVLFGQKVCFDLLSQLSRTFFFRGTPEPPAVAIKPQIPIFHIGQVSFAPNALVYFLSVFRAQPGPYAVDGPK